MYELYRSTPREAVRPVALQANRCKLGENVSEPVLGFKALSLQVSLSKASNAQFSAPSVATGIEVLDPLILLARVAPRDLGLLDEEHSQRCSGLIGKNWQKNWNG